MKQKNQKPYYVNEYGYVYRKPKLSYLIQLIVVGIIWITIVCLMFTSCQPIDRLGGYKYPKQQRCVVGNVNLWRK
jgi:hypothetical protein